jgi:hypothetical protein
MYNKYKLRKIGNNLPDDNHNTNNNSLHKNNRGQIGRTIEIILILAGAIVIYLFLAKFTAKSTFDESINTCRFSVIGQVATELSPGLSGAKSPFNINCDKRYVRIYNTKVDLGLNPTNMKPRQIDVGGKKVTRFKELTDYTVDQVIAEEMRICKYQFADGKEDIFTNDDGLLLDKKVCFVCSEIDFDPSVRKTTFDTILEYTNKTTFDDTRVTYYNYLTELTLYNTPMWDQPFFDKDTALGNLTIDLSKQYVIYVWRYKRAPLSGYKNGLALRMTSIENLNKDCKLQAS